MLGAAEGGFDIDYTNGGGGMPKSCIGSIVVVTNDYPRKVEYRSNGRQMTKAVNETISLESTKARR